MATFLPGTISTDFGPQESPGTPFIVQRVEPSREDQLVQLLAMELPGYLGSTSEPEDGFVRLKSFFCEPVPAAVAAEVSDQIGAELLEMAVERPRDWLEQYRALARPFPVGLRWWLDPRDPELALGETLDAGDRCVLKLPQRQAFGVGSHPTTQLVLLMLENATWEGCRVLDVGCGTGVLAIAAQRLGASKPVACDVDPIACLHAAENAELNAVALPVFVGSVDALSDQACFDLVVVNALPHELSGFEASIGRLVGQAGTLMVSGIPCRERDQVLEIWSGLGFVLSESRELEEWSGFSFVKPRGP